MVRSRTSASSDVIDATDDPLRWVKCEARCGPSQEQHEAGSSICHGELYCNVENVSITLYRSEAWMRCGGFIGGLSGSFGVSSLSC